MEIHKDTVIYCHVSGTIGYGDNGVEFIPDRKDIIEIEKKYGLYKEPDITQIKAIKTRNNVNCDKNYTHNYSSKRLMKIKKGIVYWCKTEELLEEFKKECEKQKLTYGIVTLKPNITRFYQCDNNIVVVLYGENVMRWKKSKYLIYEYLGNGKFICCNKPVMSNSRALICVEKKIDKLSEIIGKFGV